ncbi:MAG: DUF1566 domain-containing protein, partial [Myxococcaceae bacterium]|nr:DUF1566 domain-containing protein [Myxococcaceae bacterium]
AVRDLFTGLIWEKTISSDELVWSRDAEMGSAQAYCVGLSKGGYLDWRVPTVVELQSLVDYLGTDPLKFDHPRLWTSESHFWKRKSGLALDLKNGFLKSYAAGSSMPVRCVRGDFLSAPDGDRFVNDKGASLVMISDLAERNGLEQESVYARDRWTGLAWTRGSNPGMSQANAEKACQMLGESWHLPTVKEMITLIDYKRASPASNGTVFPFTSPYHVYFWTATPAKQANQQGFLAVSFQDGMIEPIFESDSDACEKPKCFVFSRCVNRSK